MFLLVLTAVAFHRHSDGTSHADCPVCLAGHHPVTISYACDGTEVIREFKLTFCPDGSRPAPLVFVSPSPIRAPPIPA